MPHDRYEVIIVKYGTRQTMRSEVFLNYGIYHEPDAPIGMDYFVWIIRNEVRTILVDTGFSVAGGGNRGRTTLIAPPTAWSRLGIYPASRPDILLTHAHYDHTGNLDYFPESRIVMHREEFEFWTGQYAHRTQFHHSAEDDDLAVIQARQDAGLVVSFDERLEVAPGVEMIRVGGHTPGQSVVLVQTVAGPVLLASDAVHYLEEYEDDLPFMSVANLVEMYAGFDTIRAMLAAGTAHHLVSGHDPSTLAQFPAYGAPLEGLAAIIGRAG